MPRSERLTRLERRKNAHNLVIKERDQYRDTLNTVLANAEDWFIGNGYNYLDTMAILQMWIKNK